MVLKIKVRIKVSEFIGGGSISTGVVTFKKRLGHTQAQKKINMCIQR